MPRHPGTTSEAACRPSAYERKMHEQLKRLRSPIPGVAIKLVFFHKEKPHS